MSRRGWVLFGLMSVIWGVPYLLIKVADDGGVSVPVLVFARVAIGAAVLLPLAIRRGQIRVLAGRWRWLAVFAVVEIMLPWALLSDAERHLSSSLTGLLIAVVPIIGLVLARLTGGPEQLTAVRWVGLLAGLAGVALLAGPHLEGGGAWPITEVMLVALCYATGPLIANRKLGDLPGIGMTAVCLAATALVYAVPAALTWPSRMPSAAVLGSLAGLGVLCTALAFVLFFQLIAEVGPARATVITYVNPAVAVALGVGVLGEPLTPAILAAFVLILSGSVLATRSGLPRPQHALGPAERHAPGPPERHAPGPPERHAPGPPERHAPGPPERHAPGPPERHAPGRPVRHTPDPPRPAPGPPERHAPGPAERHAPGRPVRHAPDPRRPAPDPPARQLQSADRPAVPD